jgi:serine protease Do
MLGIGSGIIIRKDGMILTNNHVIEGADKITVMFDEKHKARGRLVAADPKTDLAIVQVEGPHNGDYPVLHFGDSEQLHEGDWAIAIGSPFGLNRSMSFGIISAKGRAQVGILDIEDFIQTDAAINPGSSGGPLLNSRGELVGVNTAIFSESGGSMGIGFAIPSRIAQEVANELLAHGHVSRGWLGLTAQDLDPDLARYFKVGGTQGALVGEVAPGGPAGQAKLQTGDVITQYDHHPIDGASTLKSLVGRTKAGADVGVQVIRNSRPMTVHIAIREAPAAEPPSAQQAGQAAPEPDRHMPGFGLSVEDVPGEISELLRLKSHEGVLVVGIRPGSPAFDAGIGPGDIILSANRSQVHNAREFNRIAHDLNKADQDLAVLFVQRGPAERIYVPIKLSADPGV